MEISPKRNKQIEAGIFALNVIAALAVLASFALQFGFDYPAISTGLLNAIEVFALAVFAGEKFFRVYAARNPKAYFKAHWIEFTVLLVLLVILLRAGSHENAQNIRHFAIGIYVALQVAAKVARRAVHLASHGRNPVVTMLSVFAVLIAVGTVFLMLPASAAKERLGFTDALFTAASATTLTGLTVKSTAADISLTGQHVILVLMQLGGLGIVTFGVVFAFMAGQLFSIREKTMGDIMGLEQFGHTGKVVAFIISATLGIEIVGAYLMLDTWAGLAGSEYNKWFYSIFHAVSAFCNAGFSLTDNGMSAIKGTAGLYLVVCPLIILGGLGFGVLYNIGSIAIDLLGRFAKRLIYRDKAVFARPRRRMQLQSKIVLTATAVLIIVPVIAFLIFENNIQPQRSIEFKSVQENLFGSQTGAKPEFGVLDGLFQSISSRTAGFSTVDIGSLSAPSLAILMMLMFIGASPGSTAGGIKNVTVVIILMAAFTTIRRRDEVEIFNRSVRLVAVGRAIMIMLLFGAVIIFVSFALSITERHSGFTFDQILFETTSAVTTSGMSTGITPTLTIAGKLLIILTMLVGRLGPLSLLASLTLNIRPVRYSYPEEPVVVG